MKTLVVLSHPNFAASRLNKALANAAKSAGAEVRHLEGLYGTDALKSTSQQSKRRFCARIASCFCSR